METFSGEFNGHREFPAQRSVTRSFGVFFDLRLNWVNNGEAGDLRLYRAHYDVTVMGSDDFSQRDGIKALSEPI